MKEIKITCDHCQKDLTMTTNSMDWRISLKTEPIVTHSGAVTDMYIGPPLEKEYHFCGLGCLKEWSMEFFNELD